MACNSPSARPLTATIPVSSSTGSPKTTLFSPIFHLHRRFPNLVVSAIDSSPDGSTHSEQQPESKPDPVKRAFEKSSAYKKAKASKLGTDGGADEGGTKKLDPVKVAMEKAKEYKKGKGVGSGNGSVPVMNFVGPEGTTKDQLKDVVVDSKGFKRKKPTISSIDFVGLNFSDKKERGLPAGLSPTVDSIPDGDFPDVEIIVGDASKFKNKKSIKTTMDVLADDSKLYKPKVSSWGVFPRPDNISEAFGGGKTIHPGEELETSEIKAAKEARIRESIASYKNRIGLNIDRKIKAKCEKAMREGNSLMEVGKLQQALPYYEEVMNSVVFKSELHGLAGLEWAICQDSLNRHDEAQIMYEKLQSHPTVQVSKKARQFLFSFQAMEMMKVSRSSSLSTDYERYFDAFLDKKSYYTEGVDSENQDSLKQVLPYILFLLSPIIVVALIAIRN